MRQYFIPLILGLTCILLTSDAYARRNDDLFDSSAYSTRDRSSPQNGRYNGDVFQPPQSFSSSDKDAFDYARQRAPNYDPPDVFAQHPSRPPADSLYDWQGR